MKPIHVTVLLAHLATAQLHADTTNRFDFPALGFSILPLETPRANAPQTVVAMMMPAAEGFAANVNVQIQPYAGTMAEYAALSQKQFDAGKLTVLVHRTLGESTAVFEYTGKTQGRTLHWYSRAELRNGSIYLATATSLESRWTHDAAQLKACVDSLRSADPDVEPAKHTGTKN